MNKGIYCLIFKNNPCSLIIGKLGNRDFRGGWHIYIGSALGPGGLKRVLRHIRLSKERGQNPKWHVDYLLLSEDFTLDCVICAYTTRPLECDLARRIESASIDGFGCSDCSCSSHLFYRLYHPKEEIGKAFHSIGLLSTSKTIK